MTHQILHLEAILKFLVLGLSIAPAKWKSPKTRLETGALSPPKAWGLRDGCLCDFPPLVLVESPLSRLSLPSLFPQAGGICRSALVKMPSTGAGFHGSEAE